MRAERRSWGRKARDSRWIGIEEGEVVGEEEER